MKYTFQQKMHIDALNSQGLSSRQIGDFLGISKSGVNNYLKNKQEILAEEAYEVREENKRILNGPRIAIFDIETAAALAYTFGRNKQFISDSGIHTEGGWIICAGIRYYGQPSESTTMLYNAKEIERGSDQYVTELLYDIYKESDAVLAHNSQGFDHPMLQNRSLVHGFGPLPSVKVLDTLKIAKKKLRLPTNKLDTIGSYFQLGRKLQHSGIGLWKDVQEGSEEALAIMLDYCEQDVNLLYDVYDTMKSLGHPGTNFNAGLYYNDGKVHCNVCGGHVEPTGRFCHTQVSTYHELECVDCKALQRSRKAINSNSDRNFLTVPIN
jgi:hypothetical protein